MESSDEIGVRVESLIQQVDQLSEKAESLASSDTGERCSPATEPKTLDQIHLVDDTGDEFHALPQTSNSRLNSESEEQDENGSTVVVKSAEESKLSKMSDVKVLMSDSGSVNPQSTQQSIQMDVSGIRVRPSTAPDRTASTDIHIASSDTSASLSSLPKNQTATSEHDSLTRKVNKALGKNQTPPLSLSALDSIEVKSVSSTTSSKFAHESDRFQQSSLWRFVKQFIPETQQEIVKHKMVSELSRSTDLSSMSSNQSNLNTKPRGNQTGNGTGKSILSEQRFVDGIVYSPMGSHKSSTPDHSFISGWKYTKDSEFIHGNIRVAESESSDAKTRSKGPSDSSGLSHSADELSERVRKLLRQIDNSLDEKALSEDKEPPIVPKLRGLDEVNGHTEQIDLSSQVTGTPRSIEDLTSDERFGSFMPNNSPHKHLKKPIIPEEEENSFHETFESSLEEGEIRDDTFNEKVISEQINDELRTSKLREELEMEQIEIKLQIDQIENDSQNTQSTLKSDDAVPPDFPQHVYGSRDTSLEKMVQNISDSKMYYKMPKPAAVKEAWREITPEPTPEVSFTERTARIEPENKPVNKSVRVVEPKTAPPSNIASVVVHEDRTLNDSIRIVNDTQYSTASSTFDWYPRNMREFKALPKDKKSEFLKKLKTASKRKQSESSSSASTISNPSTTRGSTSEEKLTQKIITAIDSNVRRTIQAEIEKLKISPMPPPADVDKENVPVQVNHPVMPVQSARSQSKMSLDDIEDEIKEYKSQERITTKVEHEKKELKKNCAFMVSFGTQVEEENINIEIRELYKKSDEKSDIPLGKSSQGTQTFKAPVKRSNAWYCPIFTDRKVPIDRNALDSTKRLAENAWQRASLQEAMLIHKQEFISKSRARVRHVKLRQEQRLIEMELENERQKLFGTYTERQRVAQIHPLADKFHLGEKRQINLKTARKETTKRYNKLPEVINARKNEKHNREKVENQIKAKCFNRKIQSKVLNKL